ncbi:PDZ domain-containing protein [Amphibiibacter pelophylacis]|uniref:PDZ domain-containing protein n=1 Tax=Amphibiibacter pelophylacis TaxID=1799477 RepID=A0ACC6P3L6_9BURK
MRLRYATLTLSALTALLLGGCASTPFVLPPVPLPQLPGVSAGSAPADGRVYPGSSSWPEGLMSHATPATPVPVPASPAAVPALPPAAQSGVPRARFGLRTVDCPLPDGSRGVYVYKLLPGSPLAGSVEIGDRITRLQGVDITNSASLTNLIAAVRPLSPVQLSFVRAGASTSVSFLPPPWVPNEADLAPINQPITPALAANLCRIVTRVATEGAAQ